MKNNAMKALALFVILVLAMLAATRLDEALKTWKLKRAAASAAAAAAAAQAAAAADTAAPID